MIASAIRHAVADKTLISTLPRNVMAGITVGIVALPLSMGLAIASGVPPQHGLYTAIVGGILIALLGGSRVNISGPTAAFVVVLLPVVQQYGIGGLLLSGAMAGLMMIGFGLFRLGRLIQVIPYPVIVGFTAGIGTVIGFLQLKDFLGLTPADTGISFVEKAQGLLFALPTLRWPELLIGALTLATLILWKRVPGRIPAYLVALLLGLALATLFNGHAGLPDVDTIASRFHFEIDGVAGNGIPPLAPHFVLPWNLPGPDGNAIGLSVGMLQTLTGAALAIALLGALESLLCATVADGMTGGRHDPDSELIGQGIGNIGVAFFGGIPVTAAIARTATNIRSGGNTPVAAIVHGLFILIAILLLAPVLSRVPMASMAAVLMMVAWNMSEVRHAVRIVTRAPRPDVLVFLVCYSLTVLVDMQVAVAVGLALASVLFIKRITELTETSVIDAAHHHDAHEQIEGLVVYDVDGPLFFGAAHKALKVLSAVDRRVHTVVLDIKDVNLLDTTAMTNLESIAQELAERNTALCLIHVKPELQQKMKRYGLFRGSNGIRLATNLPEVIDSLKTADSGSGGS